MLDTAVLSSFQWDDAWLFSKVNCKRTRVTLIMDENDSNALRYHQKYKYISICGPKDIRGIMHSKLMLLFYKQYARIVIPTANLVPLDWGEAGHMENMVFLIDLPYHSDTVGGKALGRLTSLENLQSTVLDSIATAQGPHSDFYQGLHTFCACMNLKQTVLDKLSCCDFTATRGLAFVFGVGSFQRRELATRCSSYVGLEGLACQIKRLGLTCNGTVRVDYITSSLGKLRRDFLSSLYRACRGGCSPDDSSISSANRPKERGGCQRDGRSVAKGSCKEQLKDVEAQFQSHMKVYFPSHEVVERSLGGTRAAGTICLRSEHWNNPQFPKEHVYECKSVREGLIMHSKVGDTRFYLGLAHVDRLYLLKPPTTIKLGRQPHTEGGYIWAPQTVQDRPGKDGTGNVESLFPNPRAIGSQLSKIACRCLFSFLLEDWMQRTSHGFSMDSRSIPKQSFLLTITIYPAHCWVLNHSHMARTYRMMCMAFLMRYQQTLRMGLLGAGGVASRDGPNA